MSKLKDLLFRLCCAVGVAGISEASEVAAAELSKYAEVHMDDMGGVIAVIKGESDYNILLDAHIDEIGMMVTAIDDSGFLKVAPAGGIDLRVLPNSLVTVHGKRNIKAIFCSTPPHLKKDDDDKFSDFDSLYLDTGLSGKNAKELISIGDRVSFCTEPVELLNGKIAAKSLDDRAGCAALIFVAKQISERGVPPITVTIALSAQEELGCRGAKISAFGSGADEAIAVDVSFGFSSDLPAEKCGKLGEGPMLGVSPVLSKEITNKLLAVSKNKGIPIQFEGMGGTTSTNADVIGVTKSGIKCGLLSIPLKNMHTPVETLVVADVASTANLITEYIFEGGIRNA